MKSVPKTSAATAGAADSRSFAHIEGLLKNLAGKLPGYPRELAVLARLAAHIEKKMIETSNAALKPHGLNYTQYQVLVICLGSDAPVAPGELADATGERPTNITHLCDELEKRALLQRERDAHDRRRVLISLTGNGRVLLDQVQPLMWSIWRNRYRGIGTTERKLLLDSLRRQYTNLDGC